MAIGPGIPIPSAMSRVSLERPFNGADDGEDEDVGGCIDMVDGVSGVNVDAWYGGICASVQVRRPSSP